MKKRPSSLYLSIASFLHLLILAFGGAAASNVVGDHRDGVSTFLFIVIIVLLLIGLVFVYSKIGQNRQKK